MIVPKDRKPGASNGKMSKPNRTEPEQQYEVAIRLTWDSRPMNKALKRTRFAMRTIDDLLVIEDRFMRDICSIAEPLWRLIKVGNE